MINAFLKDIEKHVIAESTNLGGTNYAKHIFNVLASEDIDNGKVVDLGKAKYIDNSAETTGLILSGSAKGAVTGADKFANGEVLSMVSPTANSHVGLILSVAIGADESPRQATLESNFYNGKGEVMRVYDLMEGDRFTISENGIAGSGVKVGGFVKVDGYDLTFVEEAPTSNNFYGEIIQKINRTNGVFYKIFVRKNA